LLILAGDFLPDMSHTFNDPDLMRVRQLEWVDTTLTPWAESLKVGRIIATPGNHDWISNLPPSCPVRLYRDELFEWEGKRVWLTPWVEPCGPWNYQLTREYRKARFAAIPNGLDVLVTHGPPYEVGDWAWNGEHAGCPEMRQIIYQRKPRFVVFGHIHEGRRQMMPVQLGASTCYNVAVFGINWKPTEFDI
jgi:hypothetical protein